MIGSRCGTAPQRLNQSHTRRPCRQTSTFLLCMDLEPTPPTRIGCFAAWLNFQTDSRSRNAAAKLNF
ncbi:hypothetical protein A1356_04535 [Methylomonas koyamae]|uniref:Uncharacterized protein n=1 Tax=Methylomonas koyamae TaxID=702114 RepID=A0AA91I7R1_9GAMM|nr:hypothetical protein A1356_04535 [Methylomonas koyamae]